MGDGERPGYYSRRRPQQTVASLKGRLNFSSPTGGMGIGMAHGRRE
jgi:hypothetical protein